MTVEGRVPAKRAVAKPVAKIVASSDVCYVRELGDGNDTSVRTCTPRDLLGTAAL